MTTEHTPWELVTEDDPRGQPVPYYRGLVCVVSATPRLSVVTANGSAVDSEHWPRIGRLIAAAPELLALVEKWRLAFANDHQKSSLHDWNERLKAADAASADVIKAMGE